MRSRSADVAKLLSVEPSTPGVKRNRSKSAGAKARGRWNRVRGNGEYFYMLFIHWYQKILRQVWSWNIKYLLTERCWI